MEKDLIFITDNYPFGQGETFIETEIKYLSKKFRKIYIISRNEKDIQTRKVPENCKVYRIEKKLKKLLILYLNKIYLLDFIKEFRLSKLRRIVGFQFHGKLIEDMVIRVISEKKLKKEDIILYSYWFYNGAYAGSILKRKNKITNFISRAHGYDLYEERGYQPLKKTILENMNTLYPCSKIGEKYLKNKYKAQNIKYSYLGIENFSSILFDNNQKNKLKILSCSNLIKLKRVDMIIETLSVLERKYSDIEWIHFGDGIEREKLERLAKEKLKKINYRFMGNVSNIKIFEYYQKNEIFLFLHLSSTEGLPVSMMEVQSFGIPVIATNVGGVSEIVNIKTGILLSANPTIEEVFEAIEKFKKLDKVTYKEYRKNSYINWKINFNAKNNYNNFIKEIYNERN